MKKEQIRIFKKTLNNELLLASEGCIPAIDNTYSFSRGLLKIVILTFAEANIASLKLDLMLFGPIVFVLLP